MGIRGIIMMILGFACVPVALMDAYWGLMAYCWLSLMKPQTLVWSPVVQSMRITYFVAIAMIVRAFTSPGPRWRIQGPAVWFLVFWAWMGLSAYMSANTQQSMGFLEKFSKIGLAVLLLTGLVRTRYQVKNMMILLAMCPGLYAVRLGLFMFRGGTVTHHGGPMGMDNNDTGLFVSMSIPLLVFSCIEVRHVWRRQVMWVAAAMAVPGVIAGGSRGGLLSMAAAGFVTIWRRMSWHKAVLAVAIAVPLTLMIVPSATRQRYTTIQTYEEDASAMGRIWAWKTAVNMANRNPLTGIGVGMETFLAEYNKYKVVDEDIPHVAHSVWFSTLAGMGYPGLVMLIGMLISTFRATRRTRRIAMTHLGGRTEWAWNYAVAVESATLTFMIGASFLSQVGFEFVYVVMMMAVPLEHIVTTEAHRLLKPKELPETALAQPAIG